jgi:hypothetical protein
MNDAASKMLLHFKMVYQFYKFFIYFRSENADLMKKWIFLLIILFLISCKEKTPDTYFTTEKASQYIKSIEDICNRDNGKLWGKNLFGPMMFVDRTSRRVVTNAPDAEGLLKEKDGLYSGLYPKELIVSNIPVKFGGTSFAMIPIPTEEDEYRIKSRAVHSLYHSLQEANGVVTSTFNAPNMDEKEARLMQKLEWKALRKAVESRAEDRQLAIRDALIFRGSNRELYQKYAAIENRFEVYEGLATFTYILLCTNSVQEFDTRLFENLDRVYSMPSYARSFGSINGALYATLLYEKGFDLKSINAENCDLGKAVQNLYEIELPGICRDVAGSLALSYDIDAINKEEEKHLADINERIHNLTSTFTEKPVVFLELESPYFDFEPENVIPLDTLGTLYSSMRVSDNWGKLTIDEGGCLVSNSFKYMRITAKGFKADKNHLYGDGWHLILNNDWELVTVNQNYFVRKLMP